SEWQSRFHPRSIGCGQRFRHDRLEQNGPRAEHAVAGGKPAEHFDAILVDFTDVDGSDLPFTGFAGDEQVIVAADVDHAIGRDQERLPGVSSHADLGKHAGAKAVVQIVDEKQNAEGAAILAHDRGDAANATGEAGIRNAEEDRLAVLPRHYAIGKTFGNVGHHDVYIGGDRGEHGGVEAGLLQLPGA